MDHHGKNVNLSGVAVRFGAQQAVMRTDLEIRAGEFFSILGPSGCGKTTLLRVISGFQQPSEGRVSIGGVDVTRLGPNERPTALIFQNLALFPLMSVADNIAFGLEARGVSRAARRKRADELLAMVALDGFADRRPGQLSGGQRQRVAIARALAVEPAVLLLDEPLSALDLKLRQHMRAELKDIQRRTGVTFVYITHDQSEALAMSDRVAVMKAGRIEQVDGPDRLYATPATPFVAGFVGEQNRFSGTVAAASGGEILVETPAGPIRAVSVETLAVGDKALVMVRPERIDLANGADHVNRFEARLTGQTLEGPAVVYDFALPDGRIVVQAPNLGQEPPRRDVSHVIGFRTADALAYRPPAEAVDA